MLSGNEKIKGLRTVTADKWNKFSVFISFFPQVNLKHKPVNVLQLTFYTIAVVKHSIWKRFLTLNLIMNVSAFNLMYIIVAWCCRTKWVWNHIYSACHFKQLSFSLGFVLLFCFLFAVIFRAPNCYILYISITWILTSEKRPLKCLLKYISLPPPQPLFLFFGLPPLSQPPFSSSFCVCIFDLLPLLFYLNMTD